jgi:phosphoheptose isomerase
MKTISMTGEHGGMLAELCDVAIKVPESETYKVQELHLPVYHAICAEVEEIIFG